MVRWRSSEFFGQRPWAIEFQVHRTISIDRFLQLRDERFNFGPGLVAATGLDVCRSRGVVEAVLDGVGVLGGGVGGVALISRLPCADFNLNARACKVLSASTLRFTRLRMPARSEAVPNPERQFLGEVGAIRFRQRCPQRSRTNVVALLV